MTIVKQLKDLSLPFSQRKRSSIGSNNTQLKPYILSMILASWLGTYLEIILTGKQYYTFIERPFPDIFSIDIRFTLIGIPLLTLVVLSILNTMNLIQKSLFLMVLSTTLALMEMLIENIGWITFSEQWRNIYSFFGYFIFYVIIWLFFQWCRPAPNKNRM